MVRIRRFGVVRTANVAAALYFLVVLIFIIPFVIFFAAGADTTGSMPGFARGTAIIFLILAPFLYAGIGWIFTAIACLLYNLVAGFTGGIEMHLVNVQPAPAPAAWQPPPMQPPPTQPPPMQPPPTQPPPMHPPPTQPPA